MAHPERDFHEDDRWTEKDTEIKNAIFAAALQHHVKMEKNAALLESGGKHQQFWQDIPGTDNDGLWGGCSLPGGYRSQNTIVENSCK